jgi:quercetin dioxygenase-like cupin family protein
MNRFGLKNLHRREFLRVVPTAAAAAAGFTIANASLFTLAAAGQATAPANAAAGAATFQVFTAQEIQDDAKALLASPGNNNLVQGKNFAVVLTVETAKSAKEFEWHEKRDHILQVLDGSTIYEVGGTPKGAHSEAAGEWHAPEAEGATTLTLKKGDMLVIPRGTLHKRSTAGTVTFTLISPQEA